MFEGVVSLRRAYKNRRTILEKAIEVGMEIANRVDDVKEWQRKMVCLPDSGRNNR